jgi:hypothetical protein
MFERDGACGARLIDAVGYPNGGLKLDLATAGEPKFGNVANPEEALRRLHDPKRTGF